MYVCACSIYEKTIPTRKVLSVCARWSQNYILYNTYCIHAWTYMYTREYLVYILYIYIIRIYVCKVQMGCVFYGVIAGKTERPEPWSPAPKTGISPVWVFPKWSGGISAKSGLRRRYARARPFFFQAETTPTPFNQTTQHRTSTPPPPATARSRGGKKKTVATVNAPAALPPRP